jgi:hypothetical protein
MSLYAGSLQNFYKEWSLITEDSVLMSWIKGYKIPFISIPTQSTTPCTIPKSKSEHTEFTQAIQKLISIDAISKCSREEGEFVSNIFLVPKPNGEKRFILNLKSLNVFKKILISKWKITERQ